MSKKTPKLFLFCGLIASGKSTLARQIAESQSGILISEDHWLSSLYPGEISSPMDYTKRATRVKAALFPHLVSLLSNGITVVLDFPANTKSQRDWLRSVFETAQVGHELHFLDIAPSLCKQRNRERNEAGEHPFQVSDDHFDLISHHFEAPLEMEGFNLVRHTAQSESSR